jgi:hypothetical protein
VTRISKRIENISNVLEWARCELRDAEHRVMDMEQDLEDAMDVLVGYAFAAAEAAEKYGLTHQQALLLVELGASESEIALFDCRQYYGDLAPHLIKRLEEIL